VTKEELKRALPLAWVCADLGVALDQEGRALCPFHDDSSPSFYLWTGDDGYERWWCQPCGFGGDCYDLVMRVTGVRFPQAFERCRALLGATPPRLPAEAVRADPPVPSPAERGEELDAARARATESANDGMMCVVAGLLEADAPPATRRAADAALRGVLGWGVDDRGRLLMPHWTAAGELSGVKVRAMDGAKWAWPRSKFPDLYGAWAGMRTRRALLCEGESDTAYALVNGFEGDVLALPAGAKPPWDSAVAFLEGYDEVFIALDADDASVPVTALWLARLPAAKACRLPLGHDLRSAAPNVNALVASARTLGPPPDDLLVLDGGFVRNTKQGARRITAWCAVPVTHMPSHDDSLPAFDVALQANGAVSSDVVTGADLENARALKRWAMKRSLGCQATDSDAAAIAEWFTSQAPRLPLVFQTQRLGLHSSPPGFEALGPAAVFSDESLGRAVWRYVGDKRAPAPDDGPFDWRWLESALAMNDPSVTEPMLAWLVAASRRAEVERFPLLMLTGSSGSGKSTLADTFRTMFGSSPGLKAHLGGQTAFTLLKTLSATTSVPVFVDEWTRQTRAGAREVFQDAVPAIYSGDVAERGRQDLSTQKFSMTSPVIVAGEDAFHLDRETERMVTLKVSRAKASPDALARLTGAPIQRFARWYYDWLVSVPASELPPMPSAEDLDRISYAREILMTGWATLRCYLSDCAERDPDVIELPRFPDLSALDEDASFDGGVALNEYEAALEEGFSLRDSSGNPVVWDDRENDGTWVRWRALVPLLEQKRDVELPGRSRAMRAYFEERYEVADRKVRMPVSGDWARATFISGLRTADEPSSDPAFHDVP